MVTKRIHAALLGFALMALACVAHAQYTTDWLANTYGTLAAHVGNGARSMWVAPEGVIYTSSLWDENEGGVAIYQNGQNIGSIGTHADFQGSAITGNATSIFTALQYNRSFGSGSVGRSTRAKSALGLRIPVWRWAGLPHAGGLPGLATAATLLFASDF